MDTLTYGRFRAVSILLVAIAIWSAARGNPHLHTRGFWIAIAFAAIWAIALFRGRQAPQRTLATVIGFASSVAATLAYPALGTLLMVSVGWVGARMPWRYLRIFGLPIVLFAALVPVAAAHFGPSALNVILSQGFLNLLITFGVILLFGRFAADNTEVRAAQAKSLKDLQEAHAELQRRAAAAEELATLHERSRLSRELHDTLGHALSAITVQIEAVRRLLPGDPERAQVLLQETQGAARAAMHDLRMHLTDLREPAAPEDLGGSLRRLAEEVAARNGWRSSLDIAPVEIPEPQRRALLQVAREALQNCGRHANAHALSLSLHADEDAVSLRIADDGIGFDPQSVPRDRFGLQGMQERLLELGGKLRIETSPGSGTSIVAVLPRAGHAVGGA